MATLLQSVNSQTVSNATATCTFTTANVSSGSKIVVVIATSASSSANLAISSVKDGAGNTWTQLFTPTVNSTNGFSSLAVYALDTPAGDVGTKPTITVITVGTNGTSILLEEWSGIAAGNTVAAMVDGTPGTLTGSVNGTLTSPTYSSAATGELAYTAYGDDGAPYTWTANFATGWTTDTNGRNTDSTADDAAAWKASAGGAESAQWVISGTTGTGWSVALFAFKLAAGGGSGPVIYPRPSNLSVTQVFSAGRMGAAHSQ